MRNSLKGIIAATALAATGMVAAQPAQARDHTGVAIAAGIIGLGVGAAIASSDGPRYSQVDYYGGGYPGYGYGGGYYAQPYGYAYGAPAYYRGDDRRWRHHHRDRWDGYGRRDHDRGHRDWRDDRWRR